MKLIDKSALVAEIENLLDKGKYREEYDCAYRDGNNGALYALKNKLDALEVKEADLEKELESWRHSHFHGRRDKEASGEYLERVSQLNLAKHFFELGCASSHVSVPNIDDTLKEMGVNPDSKSAKSFKEFYYMALEKFKAQKGE